MGSYCKSSRCCSNCFAQMTSLNPPTALKQPSQVSPVLPFYACWNLSSHPHNIPRNREKGEQAQEGEVLEEETRVKVSRWGPGTEATAEVTNDAS